MTADTEGTQVTLERLYRDQRAELYRALVLITGNRDIATEAIDRGFRTWHQVPGRARDTGAALHVMQHAMRWARRRLGRNDGSIRGFQLPPSIADEAGQDLVRAMADLPLADRVLLVATRYLGYDDAAAAALAGVETEAVPGHVASLESTLHGDAATIAAALEAAAVAFHEPLSRFESVRAESLGRRAIALVGAAALTLVVVGGGIALLSGGGDPPQVRTVATGVDPVSGVAAPVALGDAEITWTQVGLPAGGEGAWVTHGQNGFVMITQDFSGPQPAHRVLRSADGETWEVVGDLPTGPNSWIQQVQAVDGRYIAVGSGFDERAGRDHPTVWISEDGAAWDRAELPVEDRIEISGMTIDLHTWVASLGSTTDGIALVGNQGAEMDLQPLIQDALPEGIDMRFGWGYSPNSLEIYGNEGRIVQRIPWDEIDVDPEVIRLMTGGRSVLWTSDDGTEWSSQVLDLGTSMGGIGSVAIADGAGAALVWGQFGGSVWAGSLDGSWERMALPGLGSASAVSSLKGKLIVIGQGADGGPGAWTSSDATTWPRIDDPDLAGNLHMAIPSSGAILVMGDATQRPLAGPAIIDLPEGTLEITTTGAHTLTAEDGSTLFSGTTEDLEYDGPDVRLVDADGGLIAIVSQGEIEQAWEMEFRSQDFEGAAFPVSPERFLVISTDTEEWQRIDLSELGSAFFPTAGATDGTTIVLTGHQEGPGFVGPGGTAWVGTIGG
ncbi:MAG: RNA polymerase sigma factor [Acidimicrobiia bacterium]